MANVNPKIYDIPVTIRVDQAFIDACEELRRAKAPLPTRAEVVREAVMQMAEALKKPARAKR